MRILPRAIPGIFVSAVLSACGGGHGDAAGSAASGNVSAPTAPILLAPGTTYTMPADASVAVPAGTTISSSTASMVLVDRADGNLDVQAAGGNLTLNADDTVITQAGVVVTVPAGATGAAYAVVTTASTRGIGTLSPSVQVLAGSPSSNSMQNGSGVTDGTGTAAVLWGPTQIAMQANGSLLLADYGSLRTLTQAGVVSTLAPGGVQAEWNGIAIDRAGDIFGSGTSASNASTSTWAASIYELPTSGGTQAVFSNWETSATPFIANGGLAIDSKGNLFYANGDNNEIVKFTPGGAWEIFAGSGARGNNDGTGAAASFSFNAYTGIAIDAADNLYVKSGIALRKIGPDGTVSTVTDKLTPYTGAIALDPSGNIYVTGFETIYRVNSTDGAVTSFAFTNSPDPIMAMTSDSSGNLYLATRGAGSQVFKVSF